MKPGDELYTVQEFASFVKLTPTWIYELIKMGCIPAYKIGRSIRIPHSAFESMKVRQSKPRPPALSDKLECIDELGDLDVLDEL